MLQNKQILIALHAAWRDINGDGARREGIRVQKEKHKSTIPGIHTSFLKY